MPWSRSCFHVWAIPNVPDSRARVTSSEHALGDLAGIDRAYRHLSDLLDAELGVPPTADTERQYLALIGARDR